MVSGRGVWGSYMYQYIADKYNWYWHHFDTQVTPSIA